MVSAAELPRLARPQVALVLVRVVSAVVDIVAHVERQRAVTVLALELPRGTIVFRCNRTVTVRSVLCLYSFTRVFLVHDQPLMTIFTQEISP